jgi:streptomycin 6-kinase
VLAPDDLLDDASRARLMTRFGPGAAAWCDALPDLVARYCQRWDLELDRGLSGGTARVYAGRQSGGRGVVLKLTPEPPIAAQEARALRAWAGTPHAVDLLAADTGDGALLLERIEPGTPVREERDVPPAGEMAGLLAGLHGAGGAGGDGTEGRPALANGLEGLFTRIGEHLDDPRVAPLVTPAQLAGGRRLARELAAGGPAVLLHGDLHLANILRAGPERGLGAIDPRPCTGDPAWDAVDWALEQATMAGAVRERIGQLCALVPGLDGDRLWRWCQAVAAVIAVLRLRQRPLDATIPFLLGLADQAVP